MSEIYLNNNNINYSLNVFKLPKRLWEFELICYSDVYKLINADE